MTQRIPAGTYKSKAVINPKSDPPSPEWSRAKSGNVQVAFDLELQDDTLSDRRASTYLTFSEGAMPFTRERLIEMGWDGKSDDLRGVGSKEFDVVVKYETFEGKERMKVDVLTSGGGRRAATNTISDAERKATMRELLGGTAATAPRPASAARQPAGPRSSFDDDASDIPF